MIIVSTHSKWLGALAHGVDVIAVHKLEDIKKKDRSI
jgi:hypothetical protein